MQIKSHQSSMMGTSTATVVYRLLVIVAIATTCAHAACKPKMKLADITLAHKLAKSSVVAYGYPMKRTLDSRFPGQNIYTVDFEIRCIFKGGPLPENIRVERVGYNDTQCDKPKFLEGEPSLVYLDVTADKTYVPTYKEDPGNEEYLDEVPAICGVTISFPEGRDETNKKESCPEEYIYDDDCQVLPTDEPPTGDDQGRTQQTVDGVKDNEAPYQPVKSGDLTQNENGGETTPTGSAITFKISTVAALGSLLVFVMSVFF